MPIQTDSLSADPDTPNAGKVFWYGKDKHPYAMNEDGDVFDMAGDVAASGNLVNNKFIKGAGANSVQDADKDVPTGDVVGTSDVQTLTNKTLSDVVKLIFKAAAAKTVASGVLTVDMSGHVVDGEGSADDDIDTINGGTAEQLLFLRPDSGITLTLKHGTGNILTNDGTDFVLNPNGVASLVYDGSNWRLMGGGLEGTAGTVNNAVLRADGTGGQTSQGSPVIITDDGKITIPDIATTGALNITERSSVPSAPASGDIYLDDGTNTASGNPGWRRCVSTGPDVWEDIGGTSGGGDYSYSTQYKFTY